MGGIHTLETALNALTKIRTMKNTQKNSLLKRSAHTQATERELAAAATQLEITLNRLLLNNIVTQ